MRTEMDGNFKEKIRETILELLENESERFYPLFIEIVEDVGLSGAIKESENTPQIEEENILKLLQA